MNPILKSKDLTKIIYSILYKAESETLEQRDLGRIKSLTLQEINVSGKVSDVDVREVGKFGNLEHLIINGFDIDDELMGIINGLYRLKTIQFTKSRFKTKKSFDSLLDYEIFDRCEGATSVVGNSRRIRIVGQNRTIIDLEELGDLSQVEELDLNDLSVKNIVRVQRMPELSTLDLSGSVIDDAKSIARLSLKTNLDDEYLII